MAKYCLKILDLSA